MKRISIVIPIYNEEENIPIVKDAIDKVFSSLSYEWEIFFVNDGSVDGTIDAISRLAKEDSRIKVIDFSRNFGKETATSAGCHYAHGDAVITMDADMQHPPEVIPKFLEAWERGAEVVYTVRKQMVGASFLKRVSSALFYWLFNRVSETKAESGTTDFRLMDRKVIDAFRRLPERERMFRGLVDWMGFRRERVEFVANERANGTARYSYVKLFRLALNSFTSFSLFPLRFAGYLGIAITIISGVLLVFMLTSRIWHPGMFTPVAVLAVSNMFLIGIVLVCLGLIALYIARIHHEVSGRPLYIVREEINIDTPRKQ
jgi:dolichol-phosphate mannosyltransferase